MYENNKRFFDLNLSNLISMVKENKLYKINSQGLQKMEKI